MYFLYWFICLIIFYGKKIQCTFKEVKDQREKERVKHVYWWDDSFPLNEKNGSTGPHIFENNTEYLEALLMFYSNSVRRIKHGNFSV